MPRLSAIFPSSLLRAKDLNGPRDVTIVGWREEYLYGKNEHVLELEGEQSGLKLTSALAADISGGVGRRRHGRLTGRSVKIYTVPKPIKDKDTGEEKVVDIFRAQKSELDKPPPKKALKGPPDDDIRSDGGRDGCCAPADRVKAKIEPLLRLQASDNDMSAPPPAALSADCCNAPAPIGTI